MLTDIASVYRVLHSSVWLNVVVVGISTLIFHAHRSVSLYCSGTIYSTGVFIRTRCSSVKWERMMMCRHFICC